MIRVMLANNAMFHSLEDNRAGDSDGNDADEDDDPRDPDLGVVSKDSKQGHAGTSREQRGASGASGSRGRSDAPSASSATEARESHERLGNRQVHLDKRRRCVSVHECARDLGGVVCEETHPTLAVDMSNMALQPVDSNSARRVPMPAPALSGGFLVLVLLGARESELRAISEKRPVQPSALSVGSKRIPARRLRMKTPASAVAFRTAGASEEGQSNSLPWGVTIEGDRHKQRLVCMCGRSRALQWRKQFVREHANC
eukprot:5409651-Amphidinium_carterae.1